MRAPLIGWGAAVLLAGAAAAQPARRAVLVDVDGVRADTFAQVYASGALPNFARALGGAVWFDNALTVTPSVTMAAQASIATGAPPARHGVVGNQWFERETGHLFDYMNANGISCVYGFTILGGPACAAGLGNRHLQLPTIYEAAAAAGLTSLVVFNQYWRGAARAAAPTSDEATAFLKGSTVDSRIFDRQMTARAIRELQANGLPAILTLYFAGADLIGHQSGIAEQIPYLTGEIDAMFGRVLDTIEALDPAWRDNVLFIVTADHGRTEVAPHGAEPDLLPALAAALPRGAHVAANGGVAFVYLPEMGPPVAALADSLAAISPAIASARPRGPGEHPRMGDLVITLREGRYFGNAATGSHHGSVFAGDLRVPLIVTMPGRSGRHAADAVSTTQIARTIADYLGFPMDTADPTLPLSRRAMSQNR